MPVKNIHSIHSYHQNKRSEKRDGDNGSPHNQSYIAKVQTTCNEMMNNNLDQKKKLKEKRAATATAIKQAGYIFRN